MRSKKKKLRICLFHFGFFYSGGGEKLVLEEIDGLKRKGFKVSCFTPVLNKKTCFPDIINKYNIKTILPELPYWFYHREVIQILLSCLLIPFLFWRFREYDVFFGANQPGVWFAFIVTRILRKKYFIYLAQPTRILYPRKIDRETGFWFHEKSYIFAFLVRVFKRFLFWADKKSVQQASIAFANGEYMHSILEKTYQRNFINNPAGVNLQPINRNRFTGKLKVKTFEITKPYLLITNRHFPQKKFEFAIAALQRLVVFEKNLKLVITGRETSYTKFLKELTNQLGVKESVIFTGLVSEKSLTSLYANCICYLYTSPEEDFGMGILEALSFGVPVVAWKKGGPKVTLQDSGFLAKPYDITDFSRLVENLIKKTDYNRKQGLLGREIVKERFSLKKHIDTITDAVISLS